VNKTGSPLNLFHPLIADWFQSQVGIPTDIQQKSWPHIAAGEHVLVTAPTGSGKTLTAFLWAINQLATGKWTPGRTRVLYVSPLKALNTDIRRNLLQPLSQLEQVFAAHAHSFPPIQVQTRSGDTPQLDRRRMLRHPPEILITTPESLNLLLSAQGGRSILGDLATVILDEIHTVIGGKRGIHLITAVDRLVALSGEFQRIAISATVKPMSLVAEFAAGFRMEGDVRTPRYVPRPMRLVRSRAAKTYDLSIRSPEEQSETPKAPSFWDLLVPEFQDIIRRNRSSLFFAKSRRLSEKLTLKINSGSEHPIAYAHHGSLAKELRLEVENRLKSGDLKAIVATNSLELGIDIGDLDEVILVQSPPSISSAVQRIGRAGHRVGETSCGTFYPTHNQDIVESAVIARAVLKGDIEDTRPVEGALDVLAQIIISMTGTRTWDLDSLFAALRTSWPYRRLSREQFDLVLHMLSGRYADTRIRDLKPRISLDRLDNTASARKGALLQLYISGGTIPDRGYYHLRHAQTGALIGELDEEFVWEANAGKVFTFGTQSWKIQRITHNDVLVTQAPPKSLETPFWKAEIFNRDFHLSQKIGRFLEEADTGLEDPTWQQDLQTLYLLTPAASARLQDYLRKQKQATASPLPHRHHVLIENIQAGPGGAPGNQVVLHTGWGGRVNRPFALALDSAWEEQFGHRMEIFAADDSIVLQLPDAASAEDLFGLVDPADLDRHLHRRLENSGFFGARFRECAGRALLLGKRRLNERMPLWMSRLRSQKLFQAVLGLTDFPILLETWRTCLQDEFDLPALQAVLQEIASGVIRISACTTPRPSPMAQGLSWAQINRYMYAGDELPSDRSSRLRTDLLREVVFSPGLRPAIPPAVIRTFEAKRRRTFPGYAPGSARDLIDWIKERLVIPWPEWEELLAAIDRDLSENEETSARILLDEVGAKLVRLHIPTADTSLLAGLERLPEILAGFNLEASLSWEPLMGSDPAATAHQAEILPHSKDLDVSLTSLMGEWIQFYGPLTPEKISRILGLRTGPLQLTLEDLLDSEALITGRLVESSDQETVCDTENFEILLRMARAAAVPQVEPKSIEDLQPFLASVQGLARPEGGIDTLFHTLEQLTGHTLPAAWWEADIFPARIPGYRIDLLDTLLRQGSLRWQGDGEQRIRFVFEEDLPLMPGSGVPTSDPPSPAKPPPIGEATPISVETLFPDPAARYDFAALLPKTDHQVPRLEAMLWEGVWNGSVSNDTFSALRRGLENRFKVADALERQRRSQRAYGRRRERLHLTRWKEAQAYPGNWLRLPQEADNDEEDLIEQEERRKDRVRILLDRYGILFRELLHREPPLFRWSQVFRTLRLMELSGEVLAGYFFHEIPGPQFISHRGLRLFQGKFPEDAIYWMSAVDPASLCGIPLESMRGRWPRRVDSTHLVFKGKDLALISQRKGRQLSFLTSPEDRLLGEYLIVLRHLLTREFSPLRRIIVETINDLPAARSPFLPALRQNFDTVVDVKQVSLYRKVV
jgi:ATP-dependent Lhr-like helicase